VAPGVRDRGEMPGPGLGIRGRLLRARPARPGQHRERVRTWIMRLASSASGSRSPPTTRRRCWSPTSPTCAISPGSRAAMARC
jgi:hypothetical protein